MQMPFHPLIVHLPLALAFILPPLIVIFAFMIKINKMTPRGWLIVVGLQMALTISGYVALESGQNEEHQVEKVVAKDLIHAHEDASEIFVGSTVIALVISVAAFFLRQEFQFPVKMVVVVVSVLSCYCGYRAGKLGGELVYKYGAAAAYVPGTFSGIVPKALPGPSDLKAPVENESLKVDETDYGDEAPAVEEELKQED